MYLPCRGLTKVGKHRLDLLECSVLFRYILKEYCQETEVFSRTKQEYLTDRKTSWLADLTVWLTDMYHVVSFSLQVKKLIKTRGKAHP